MITAETLVQDAANRAWTPPPSMSVWEWADEYRRLGADSPEPGKYRTDRTPYMRQIMETLSPTHPARHISYIKPNQIAGTTAALNWLGYIVHQCPSPTIITLPSEGVAKEWSTQRLTQLVEETPVLSPLLINPRRRSSMFLLRIVGTSVTIKIAWSTSAKKLRSTPAAYLISDEVDGFENDPEGEGSVLKLLDGRFDDFPRGKHFKISTPTRKPSKIYGEFMKGDQRRYFVPCPHCHHFQLFDFHHLRYSDGGPIRYVCPFCRKDVEERYKTQMLHRGVWVATRGHHEVIKAGFDDPNVMSQVTAAMSASKNVSFHLNSMYSPIGWYSWATMVEDWQDAQADVQKLKSFCNTKLAEEWEERGEAPAVDTLYSRREMYAVGVIPAPCLFLTAACDIQPNRIEFEVKGWSRSLQSWSVAYEVIQGDTLQSDVWNRLRDLINRDWPHANGGTLPIWGCAIDTGFRPENGYAFCRQFPQPQFSATGTFIYTPRTVFPIKGGHSWDKSIEGASDVDSAEKRGGLRIVTLGSPYLTLVAIGRLRVAYKHGDPHPPFFCHYPDYSRWVFDGLCAESLVSEAGGRRKFVVNGRNEPLDLLKYQIAIVELCNVASFPDDHWARLEAQTKVATAGAAASRQPERRSERKSGGWLSGGEGWLQR